MKTNYIYLHLLLESPGSRYQVDFFLHRHFNILNAESSQLTRTLHMGSTKESRLLEL